MLTIKALHIIALVAWFAGLFYLPRLFVYHAASSDSISLNRFITMERRLYYSIMWPAAILTTVSGLWLLLYFEPFYLKMTWMHLKLLAVLLLWGYHLSCGHYYKLFRDEKCLKKSKYFRFFNEVPTIFLIVIVILVVVKPF